MTPPRYLADILNYVAAHMLVGDAGVLHVEVTHEPRCPLFGGGNCTCGAVVTFVGREQ